MAVAVVTVVTSALGNVSIKELSNVKSKLVVGVVGDAKKPSNISSSVVIGNDIDIGVKLLVGDDSILGEWREQKKTVWQIPSLGYSVKYATIIDKF
jgi:hypothetical protein